MPGRSGGGTIIGAAEVEDVGEDGAEVRGSAEGTASGAAGNAPARSTPKEGKSVCCFPVRRRLADHVPSAA